MHLILKLTSSFLFLLFLSCSPVPAQESLGAGKNPEPFKEGDDNVPDNLQMPPKPGGSVGIFYNPCMDGTTFAEVLAKRPLTLEIAKKQYWRAGDKAKLVG